jgi:hypothetical protein
MPAPVVIGAVPPPVLEWRVGMLSVAVPRRGGHGSTSGDSLERHVMVHGEWLPGKSSRIAVAPRPRFEGFDFHRASSAGGHYAARAIRAYLMHAGKPLWSEPPIHLIA